MTTRNQILVAGAMVVLTAGFVAVFGLRGQDQGTSVEGMDGHDHSAMAAADEAQPVTLDADAARRIGVTFATVTRGSLSRTVETVGFATFDETRITTVNPKVEGWVERLYVDFTGAPVRPGQPLMEVYSPALVSAQEELMLAVNLARQTATTGGSRSAATAEDLLSSARRRLAYWDIPEEEIRAIEEGGQVRKTLTLRAPAGGVVVETNVVEGARIQPGMDLIRVADLGRIWIEAEVFERDLSLVGLGNHAMVSFEAYPGEMFHGSVTYVYPTVSPETRTGRIRIELPNPELKLKPGMYAAVELHLPAGQETLLVPRSAVLQTGERTVVFHRMSNGQLHPMEVVTGLSSGDQIQVLSGLREGHVVAASANFLIDAESNLSAAMAGMAGMDHSTMDHSGMDHSPDSEDPGDEMDHSGHDMSGMAADSTAPLPDTAEGSGHVHEGHTPEPEED